MEASLHFKRREINPYKEYFVQYAYLCFVSPANPKKSKNETRENSEGVLVGRRSLRKENFPF